MQKCSLEELFSQYGFNIYKLQNKEKKTSLNVKLNREVTSSLSNKATIRMACSLDRSLGDLDESIRALNAQ